VLKFSNDSKNDDNKPEEEKVAATTDIQKKTITGDGHYQDGTVHYDDDFELTFCQEGRVSEVKTKNAGTFDYDKAYNQVLSQMDSIEINPWWVLLDNCSTVNIFSNGRLLRNIRPIDMYVKGEVSLILCTDIEIYHIGRTDAL
jgi:hypothetical protein